jgi:hypothetical protein
VDSRKWMVDWRGSGELGGKWKMESGWWIAQGVEEAIGRRKAGVEAIGGRRPPSPAGGVEGGRAGGGRERGLGTGERGMGDRERARGLFPGMRVSRPTTRVTGKNPPGGGAETGNRGRADEALTNSGRCFTLADCGGLGAAA